MEDSTKNLVERKRLWVITELYYPEETSTGYYLTRIAEGLAKQFDVKALCGQPNYSARGVVAPKHEIHKNVEIFRVSGTTLDKNVIPFRIINMLTLGASVFAKAIVNFKKGDRVLVVTNPPSMPFITALASLVRGTSYTLLIHDNYPEILIAAGKTKPDSMLSGFINYCNRWLYKYAARIIVVGRDMHELISIKTAGLDIPITTIQNWAELESVSPAPKAGNALLRELGLSKKFVFLYAGNMGHPNDLESIVECAELLTNTPDIHFIFLGTGVKRPWLEAEVATRKLENITILDPKPRSEQQIFLNACDVAIVSLVSQMKGVSMPSRTYNALAAGKPILALTEPGSEVAQVIDDDAVGWVVSPGSPGELCRVVREIYEQRHQIKEMGERAANSASERYSLEKALEKYEAVFR